MAREMARGRGTGTGRATGTGTGTGTQTAPAAHSCHNETVKDNGGHRIYKVYTFRAGRHSDLSEPRPLPLPAQATPKTASDRSCLSHRCDKSAKRIVVVGGSTVPGPERAALAAAIYKSISYNNTVRAMWAWPTDNNSQAIVIN